MAWVSNSLARLSKPLTFAGDGVSLTAYEADLLEPLPRAAYKPWVVPLTFRPNDAAEETADD